MAKRPFGVRDRQDRVADELTRSVVRDVATAVDGDEVGADRRRIAAEVLGEVRVLPVREHVIVLEQQQMLLTTVVEQRLLDGKRLAVRHPSQPSDPQWPSAAYGAGHVRARRTNPWSRGSA